MKNHFFRMSVSWLLIGLFSLRCLSFQQWPRNYPVYDHILIVIEENKYYDEIIGSKNAPYMNTLRTEGANLTKMFAEEHHSEGNYFWLFSGSNQHVGFADVIPNSMNNQDYPFKAHNLGEQLIAKGYSFRGFSEGLPATGSSVERDKPLLYARKHVPWISFANLPNGTNADSSVNLQFNQFPSDYSKLPTVCFVIPNLIDDMHDGPSRESVRTGDRWLQEKLDAYYRWAKSNNSLLIVTFDENEDRTHITGLTDPADTERDRQNRIPTIIAGAHIIPGDYAEGKGITHVNILRTLEAMYGLERCGAQQSFAAKYGISDESILTDIFAPSR